MKGEGKKGAEGRRIVDDIFLHKARAERKGAEGFTEMMLGAAAAAGGPSSAPPGTYGSYYSRLGGRGPR